jgi:hypothetical protein
MKKEILKTLLVSLLIIAFPFALKAVEGQLPTTDSNTANTEKGSTFQTDSGKTNSVTDPDLTDYNTANTEKGSTFQTDSGKTNSVTTNTDTTTASGNPWQTGIENAKNSGLPGGAISEIIFSLAGWLLIILGSIAVIGFVIAGILYLTSAGDEDRMKKAKQGMIYAIIGVVVGLLGYVIVQAVDTWLRANDTF